MEMGNISQSLDLYLRLQSFPVAVRMLSPAEEIPSKARMPKRDLGAPIPLCQGITMARRNGWLMALGSEDMSCPMGALALGLLPAKEKFLDGSFGVPFGAKDPAVTSKMAKALPRLEFGKYTHIAIAPLQRADFIPHLVIVYGSPAQISRLVQAGAYRTGDPVVSSGFGVFACAEEITRTILSDQCQFILAGGGDRVLAQTHDHEVAFAIPMSKVEATIDGLKMTHEAGFRYPTRVWFGLGSTFLPVMSKLMDYLRQND